MRLNLRFLLLALMLGGNWSALAQPAVIAEVTRLDNLQREALLKGDTVTMKRLFAKDFVVNTPDNKVINYRQVASLIRNGMLDYASFERTIDKATVSGNIVILMGQEVLKPRNQAMNAGKTVMRRFTNVWVQTGGSWHLLARQASNIGVQ
jgi:hypothetical protein